MLACVSGLEHKTKTKPPVAGLQHWVPLKRLLPSLLAIRMELTDKVLCEKWTYEQPGLICKAGPSQRAHKWRRLLVCINN